MKIPYYHRGFLACHRQRRKNFYERVAGNNQKGNRKFNLAI
jgi:hypothetical protein